MVLHASDEFMTIKENKPASRSNAVIALFVLICSFALLLISMVASIGFGASSITIQTIIDSILNYNPNDSSHITTKPTIIFTSTVL